MAAESADRPSPTPFLCQCFAGGPHLHVLLQGSHISSCSSCFPGPEANLLSMQLGAPKPNCCPLSSLPRKPTFFFFFYRKMDWERDIGNAVLDLIWCWPSPWGILCSFQPLRSRTSGIALLRSSLVCLQGNEMMLGRKRSWAIQ